MFRKFSLTYNGTALPFFIQYALVERFIILSLIVYFEMNIGLKF